MIRTPTPAAKIWAWYHAAMRGERPPVSEDAPEPGYFRARFVKDGPWLPIRIWLHQPAEGGELTGPEELRAVLDGKPVPLGKVWPRCAGKPISEEAYLELLRSRMGSDQPSKREALDLARRPVRP